MPDDEDEDDPGTITNVRYPVMPSLVALQQMRNRLHLARLGKKLMKWSALASGRELRVVSEKLIVAYEGFEAEIANAFMKVARCRYYFPDLNKIVLEDMQKMAMVTVTSSFKSSGGVKLRKYEILEHEDVEQYPYLGLGAGGQAIEDTKNAWTELLKKFISILELREAFDSLELSHKNATKKENVLGKLIIPRLMVTIQYILQELEELQREELFRIKKVVQHKAKRKRQKEEILPKPSPQVELQPEIVEKQPIIIVPLQPEPIKEPRKPPEPTIEPRKPPEPIIESPKPPQRIIEPPPPEPIIQLPPSPASPPLPPCVECIAHSTLMEELLAPDQQIQGTCLQNTTTPSVSKGHLEKILEEILKLSEGVESKENLNALKSCINKLKQSDKRVKSHSTVEIMKKCKHVKTMAESSKRSASVPHTSTFEKKNVKILENEVNDLENHTKDIAVNKGTASVNNYLDACKDFKRKIEEYRTNPPDDYSELNKIIKQLDEAIALSSAVKENNVIGKNTKEFIRYCEKSKIFFMDQIAIISKTCCDLSSLTSESGKTTPTLRSTQADTKRNKCKHEVCDCDDKDDNIHLNEEIHRKILDYIRGTSIDSSSIHSAPSPSKIRHNLPTDKKKEPGNQFPFYTENSDKSLLSGTSKDTSCISSSKGSKTISFNSTLSGMDTPEDKLKEFDTKIKKVVKIKRVLNDDGTISEQVHTLIIKEEKLHPDKLSLGTDDDLQFSYNDLEKEISNESEDPSTSKTLPCKKNENQNLSTGCKRNVKDKDVNYCIISDQVILTPDKPIRMTKSETAINLSKNITFLKSCISEFIEKSNISISSE